MTAAEVRYRCNICLESYEQGDTRVLTCGHGFCKGCTNDIFSKYRRRRCPLCREPIEARTFPLYLDPVIGDEDEPSEESQQRLLSRDSGLPELDKAMAGGKMIVEGLSKMDGETGSGTVDRAARKVEKVVKELAEQGVEIQDAILHALNSFKKRIKPLFHDLEEHTAALQAAKETIAAQKSAINNHKRETDAATHSYARLTSALDNEKRARKKAENLLEQSVAAAEQATTDVVAMRLRVSAMEAVERDLKKKGEELEEWRGKTANMKARYEAKKNEVRKLQDNLTELKEQVARSEAAGLSNATADTIQESLRNRAAQLKENIYEIPAEESQSLIVLDDDVPHHTSGRGTTASTSGVWERKIRVPAQRAAPDSLHQAKAPARPMFKSDWNIAAKFTAPSRLAGVKRKAGEPLPAARAPFVIDPKGKIDRPVATGPIKRKKYSG